MAGYLDWMNPNRQATHMDRLLNDPRNPTILGEGSFQPTRETLPATPPGTTDEFIDGRWVPRDGLLRRENMMIPPPMRDRYPAEFDPVTALKGLQRHWQGQMRLQKEEVPQTQRPAKPTKEFPWGQSIADSFMGGLRKIDESPFWREDGSPSDAWQQLKNALTGPRDPEVGRQFDRGPVKLPFFPVY